MLHLYINFLFNLINLQQLLTASICCDIISYRDTNRFIQFVSWYENFVYIVHLYNVQCTYIPHQIFLLAIVCIYSFRVFISFMRTFWCFRQWYVLSFIQQFSEFHEVGSLRWWAWGYADSCSRAGKHHHTECWNFILSLIQYKLSNNINWSESIRLH